MSRFTERLPLLPGKPLVQYAVTVVLCLVALWLRWELDGAFPPGYPFLTFFPAVILSSFLFGPRPGLVAAVLCGLFAWYVFIPPRLSFAVDGGTITAMMFYTGVVAVDIGLVHLMQAANARLLLAREEVRALAEERGQLVERSELLFQEMQHRVGNNLQMVGAVLSLQMRNLTEPTARRALSDAAARLQVIGNIQRQLYRQDGQLVPLDSFLTEVCAKMMASSARPGITCKVDAQPDIVLRPDSAVPVALIVTEAIANALEHGFRDRESGSISVRVASEDGAVFLCVEDDGAGLPPGFDAARAESIGLRISRVLSRQLEAEMALENGARGACMTLRLPSWRLADSH
ncbi:sensor histidine kinase [Novosphingobium soli]|uniref:histidine kinase n=1 Tax=Novosphingobium soli TaxID=574956 RepID=A0ABV6CUF2_9SPHN